MDTYAVDSVGNRTRITYDNGDYVDYGYDDNYRLTSEVRKDSGDATLYSNDFLYDPAGNRTRLVAYQPVEKVRSAAVGPSVRVSALRDLAESEDSRRSRALISTSIARPRCRSTSSTDCYDGATTETVTSSYNYNTADQLTKSTAGVDNTTSSGISSSTTGIGHSTLTSQRPIHQL